MNRSNQSLGKNGVTLLTPTRATDRTADRLIAFIDSYEGSWDASTVRVTQVYIPTGPEPGHALIEIRRTGSSRKANKVAFGTPWEEIKFGQRVTIGRARPGAGTVKRFWTGSVAIVEADLAKDAILVTAYDDRWLLQDLRLVGAFFVDPETGDLHWRQGWPAHFNPGGIPNMMLSNQEVGGVAVPGFAPHPDYGLEPGKSPPPPTELYDPDNADSGPAGKKVACYWGLSWMFRYLHYALGPWEGKDSEGEATEDDRYEGHAAPKTCPSWVSWSPGMASWIDNEATAFFEQGRGQGKAQASGTNRKGRDINADGFSALDLMEIILATAGGYTLGWQMSATQGTGGAQTGASRLSVVPAVSRGGTNGSTLYLLRGDDVGKLMPRTRFWTGGTYREDASDFVSRTMSLGSLVKIEKRVDTYVTTALKKRWSDEEFTALKKRGNALNVDSPDKLRALFSEFPNVLAAWKLDNAFDFQEDTSEAERPRAPIPRPILPYLLSWLGTIANDYVAQRYPIRIETSPDDGSTWATITDLTGLEVLDDGTILIPSLRELTIGGQLGSWRWNNNEPYIWPGGMVLNEIRMTVAIPCDHRIAAVCKLINSQLDEFDDTVRTPDTNRISASLDRQDVLDLRGLYELWLRKDSWPVPESQKSDKAEDKPSRDDALRNDHKLLRSHGRRHMFMGSRLKRGGYFSKDCIDTSILELGKEYGSIVSLTESGRVATPAAFVRSAIEYLNGPEFMGTRMHVE